MRLDDMQLNDINVLQASIDKTELKLSLRSTLWIMRISNALNIISVKKCVSTSSFIYVTNTE